MGKTEPIGLLELLLEYANAITPDRMLMNTNEVCEILGISDSKARKMQDDGILSQFKLPLSNRRKFDKIEVYKLAATNLLKKHKIDGSVNLFGKVD